MGGASSFKRGSVMNRSIRNSLVLLSLISLPAAAGAQSVEVTAGNLRGTASAGVTSQAGASSQSARNEPCSSRGVSVRSSNGSSSSVSVASSSGGETVVAGSGSPGSKITTYGCEPRKTLPKNQGVRQ